MKNKTNKVIDKETNDYQVFVNKLKSIKIDMTVKEFKSLFGEPQFIMDSSATFSMFGGAIPESMKNRQNW